MNLGYPDSTHLERWIEKYATGSDLKSSCDRGYSDRLYQKFLSVWTFHCTVPPFLSASCSSKETISSFWSGIENSGWLKHIHLVLEASIFSAKASTQVVRLIWHKPSGQAPRLVFGSGRAGSCIVL